MLTLGGLTQLKRFGLWVKFASFGGGLCGEIQFFWGEGVWSGEMGEREAAKVRMSAVELVGNMSGLFGVWDLVLNYLNKVKKCQRFVQLLFNYQCSLSWEHIERILYCACNLWRVGFCYWSTPDRFMVLMLCMPGNRFLIYFFSSFFSHFFPFFFIFSFFFSFFIFLFFIYLFSFCSHFFFICSFSFSFFFSFFFQELTWTQCIEWQVATVRLINHNVGTLKELSCWM